MQTFHEQRQLATHPAGKKYGFLQYQLGTTVIFAFNYMSICTLIDYHIDSHILCGVS